MIRTVHIVDDDEAVRVSLATILSLQRGMSVRSYESGEAFLGEIDGCAAGVLLLDIHMPGTGGFEVLDAIGDHRGIVPIILTGQGDIALAVRAMKSGAADFLEKPCDARRLLDSIGAAFERLADRQAAAVTTDAALTVVARLSRRERAVFDGLVCGWSNKAIAQKLDLSPRTVEIHRANMMEKLEVRSLSDVLRIAFVAGLASDSACM